MVCGEWPTYFTRSLELHVLVTAFMAHVIIFFFFFFAPLHQITLHKQGQRTDNTRMAPPKQQKMPSMKELQSVLAALEAEGGLAIGGGDGKLLL